MALYIVVNPDGSQQRVATVPLETVGDETLVLLNEWDGEPPAGSYAWDRETRTYVALPVVDANAPISRTRLSKREFRARLGHTCRVEINVRLMTPATTPEEVEMVATLQDLKDELLSVDLVDVTHPATVAGINFLVALGYLTAAQAATVLAPSTVAEE